MVVRPRSTLPIIPTDTALRDPYDDDYVGSYQAPSVHPMGTRFGPIANLPRNFGRSTLDAAETGWAKGLVGVTFPMNFASNESLEIWAHKAVSHVGDLMNGWQPLPININVGNPTFGSPIFSGIGAQDKGEYVYFAYDTQTGFGGYETTRLYRFNHYEFIEQRYSFAGYQGPSEFQGLPVAREMFVADTSPPLVFFFDGGLNIWHMLDDGKNIGTDFYYTTGGYSDDGTYSGTPLTTHHTRTGQYAATLFDLPQDGPYRPDRIYVGSSGPGSQGGNPAAGWENTVWRGASGMSAFRSWDAPTEWPDLWIVNAHYTDPTNMTNPGWNGTFDIYRVPNANAGQITSQTSPGWDPNWRAHKFSSVPPIPGYAYDAGVLTFRFHKDRKQRDVIWLSCVGGTTGSHWPNYPDDYNNAWYIKSLNNGQAWGRWQRGPIAHGYRINDPVTNAYNWAVVGNLTNESYQVPIVGTPVLTYTNDLVVPISYSEYHGAPAINTRPATLYAISYEGSGGGQGAPQPPIFKRGELNRATWL